jgi:hypothetical protein
VKGLLLLPVHDVAGAGHEHLLLVEWQRCRGRDGGGGLGVQGRGSLKTKRVRSSHTGAESSGFLAAATSAEAPVR